jgi:peptide/nickel transport system ATP-binding protein
MAGSGSAHLRDPQDALLRVENLVVEFGAGRGKTVSAVANVSFDLQPGETLGLVGESGCGKSTTGKAIMQLPPPTKGSVRLGDTELTSLRGEALRRTRPRMQMIFQDPISSLNPRRTVTDIVEEPLKIWNMGTPAERTAKVAEVLDTVGIDTAAAAERKPHEFSGGQCQRISIARAVVTEPQLIICDEPVSALDVSVQAQILNLLEDMKARFGLTLVFVAHDLAVVKNVSDRVAVMYLGKLCEIGPPHDLYRSPAHPYTAALLSAIPIPDPRVEIDSANHLAGDLPSPIDPPTGCRFRTRCPHATEVCAHAEPQMQPLDSGHFVACHHPLVTPVAVSPGA